MANSNQKLNYLSPLFDYDHIINEFTTVATSAIDRFESIKPMFDINMDLNRNETTNKYYKHIFGFEKLFESHDYAHLWRDWMRNNWTASVTIAICYVLFVFTGKYIMRNRPKYELRFALIIWNIFLASFSIMGTIRVLPDFIQLITNNGVVYSVCNNDFAYGITGFWSLMFILSKLPELVDTLFIVLRKQELIFLHWYHHTTVLVYCWFSYKDFASTGRWFMTMNYLVHSLMYSYYAFKAMRIKVPKFVSQLITTGQILQMIAGCFVNYIAYQTKLSNGICNISDDNIKYSSLMYFSYFVLFFNFFINAYIYNKTNNKRPIVATQSTVKKLN